MGELLDRVATTGADEYLGLVVGLEHNSCPDVFHHILGELSRVKFRGIGVAAGGQSRGSSTLYRWSTAL